MEYIMLKIRKIIISKQINIQDKNLQYYVTIKRNMILILLLQKTQKKLNQKKDLDFMVKLIKEKNHIIQLLMKKIIIILK